MVDGWARSQHRLGDRVRERASLRILEKAGDSCVALQRVPDVRKVGEIERALDPLGTSRRIEIEDRCVVNVDGIHEAGDLAQLHGGIGSSFANVGETCCLECESVAVRLELGGS